MRFYFPPRRPRYRRLLLLAVLVLLAFVFRYTLLRGLSNHLIVEDEKQKVDAIFVLSGDPVSRAPEAAQLFREHWAPWVYCLGGEKNTALEIYGIQELSCAYTRKVLLQNGMDSTRIRMLCEGSSTWEEFEAIQRVCQEQQFRSVMVVSSKFHTRRIHTHFRDILHRGGVNMVLRGAAARTFHEQEWWKSEEGLIFLNNEYIKNLYYWLKY